MKRARPDENIKEESVEIMHVLVDDVLYLIAAHLATPRDLLNFGRSCHKLYDLCRINNLWASMIHRSAFGPGACGLPKDALVNFLSWLTAQFSSAEMIADHYLVSVSQEVYAADGCIYPVHTFSHWPPDRGLLQAPTLRLGPGTANQVQHTVATNCLIEKIRDIVYLPMQHFSRTTKGLGIPCTCSVCKVHEPPTEKARGFKLVSPFDKPFPASLLWYTVYKMCAVDAWLGQSYAQQQEATRDLWSAFLEAYAREISLSALGHPEAKPATVASRDGGQPIGHRPCAWYRPSAHSLASAEQAASGSTRACSHCGLPMPFRSNQLIIAQAISGANPFGQSGSNVYCSTGCFLDEVLVDMPPQIACSNARCTGHLSLREAVNLDRFLTRTVDKVDEALLPDRRVINIIKDGESAQILIDMRIFDVAIRSSMHELETIVGKALRIAERNSQLCTARGLRTCLSPDYMLTTFTVGRSVVDSSALAGHRGCVEEVWERRRAIFESCSEILDASTPPWRFTGSRIPLARVLYPTNDLRRPKKEEGASLPPPYATYCTHGCALPGSRGADARCLNSACGAPFNICTATISFECFEVAFYPQDEAAAPITRGYVCDRHCFEMYIEERQRQVQGMLQYRQRRRDEKRTLQ